MKCDVLDCLDEPKVFIVDKSQIDLSKIEVMKPGMIIPCDDPTSFQKYCDKHWQEMIP